MMIDHFYWALLALSLGLLLSQTLVYQKRAVHLVFALFSGSIAMVATRHLTADSLGPYQHLIALGTCATCNGYWLVSRALFRRDKAISIYHVLFACSVAILVVSSESLSFAEARFQLSLQSFDTAHSAMDSLLNLLSSSMLVLTVWEGCNGFKKANTRERAQRLVFLGSFGGALMGCMLLNSFETLRPWLMIFSAFEILIITQALILWRFHGNTIASWLNLKTANEAPPENDVSGEESAPAHSDPALLNAIEHALHHEKIYLQTHLKLVDFAQRLQVPEYRVSRALRQHFNARNFNQYINELRIQHATQLLQNPKHDHWPMLTVGLESGFASAAPFTRAFKAMHGCTPLEFKKHQIDDLKWVKS